MCVCVFITGEGESQNVIYIVYCDGRLDSHGMTERAEERLQMRDGPIVCLRGPCVVAPTDRQVCLWVLKKH